MLFPSLLLCLQVVISSFEPFLSDIERGLRFLHLGGGGGGGGGLWRKRRTGGGFFFTVGGGGGGGGGESYAENEDPGQIFLIIENRVVSYSPLVSRSRCE